MSIWSDSLLIGVARIDHQHKELVKKLDDLMEACRKGEGDAEIEKTLRFAVSYVKEHFHDEEELQAQYAYPDMDSHKKLHAEFVMRIIDLVQEFQKSGANIELTTKVNKTLVVWLVNHIRTEDKKLGEHIKHAGGA